MRNESAMCILAFFSSSIVCKSNYSTTINIIFSVVLLWLSLHVNEAHNAQKIKLEL